MRRPLRGTAAERLQDGASRATAAPCRLVIDRAHVENVGAMRRDFDGQAPGPSAGWSPQGSTIQRHASNGGGTAAAVSGAASPTGGDPARPWPPRAHRRRHSSAFSDASGCCRAPAESAVRLWSKAAAARATSSTARRAVVMTTARSALWACHARHRVGRAARPARRHARASPQPSFRHATRSADPSTSARLGRRPQ